MTSTWFACCFVATAVMVTAAYAETARTVMYDGTVYAFEVADQTLTISFIDPPVDLRELGVTRGNVLLQGTWQPSGVLEGDAYVFAPHCPPIAYPVRGIVDQSGQLVVVGPQPTVQGCAMTGSQWNKGSIMRFTAASRPAREPEERAKPRARAKPKAEARARPRPRPQRQQPVYRQPWENQWQWR